MAAQKVSASIPAEVLDAARSRAGQDGLSAFVTKSLQRQLSEERRRAALDEYLKEMDATYGRLEEHEIEEALEWFRG